MSAILLTVSDACTRGATGVSRILAVDGGNVQNLYFNGSGQVETIELITGAQFLEVSYLKDTASFQQTKSRSAGFPKVTQTLTFENSGLQLLVLRAIRAMSEHGNLHLIIETVAGEAFYMGISYWPTLDYLWESGNAAVTGGKASVDAPGGQSILTTTITAQTRNFAPQVSEDLATLSVAGPPPINPNPDTAAPIALIYSPQNNITGVSINTLAPKITFNEAVQAGGAGSWRVYNYDTDALVHTVSVASGVTFNTSANSAQITTELVWAADTRYYILVDANSVQDLAGNGWPGISSKNTWNFTTASADSTPPALSTLTPADGATDQDYVSLTCSIELDEAIQAGTGNIFLYNYATDALVASYDVNSSDVSISGQTASFDVGADIASGVQYYIIIPAGVLLDLVGNSYAGLTAKTDWDFTTIIPDTTAPTVSSLLPLDGATGVQHDTLVTVITFDENIQAGTGNFLLKDYSDDSTVATIAAGDAAVTITGTQASIDWGTRDVGQHYYITVASGVLEDLAGNAWAGFAAKTDWDFETLAMAFSGSTTKQTDFKIQMICQDALIDWGDGSALESVSFGGVVSSVLHTYASPGTYNFAVYCPASDVTRVDLNGQDLTGTLDVSLLNDINQFRAYTNSNLTAITMPSANTATWTYFYVYSTGITSLDLSGLSSLGGFVWMHDNSSLATITWGSGAGVFSSFRCDNCALTGTIDLSGYTGLGASVRGDNNSGVTSVLLPTSTYAFTTLRFDHCNITGVCDASGLAGIAGSLNMQDNPLMTGFTFPASPTGGGFTSIYFNECDALTSLDFSAFGSNFSATSLFYFHTCPALTSITFPTTSLVINNVFGQNSGLDGTLDISGLSNMTGTFSVYGNSDLTDITFPTCTNTLTNIAAYSCDLTGTLDVSDMTGFTAGFNVHSNPSLTGITLPTSSAVIASFYAYGTALTSLDLSGLTGLGGIFSVYGISTLTSITWPTSSTVFSQILIRDNDLTGTTDMSGLTGFGGTILAYGNANLTGLTLPTSSVAITNIQFYDCDLTGTIDASGLTGLAGIVLFHSNPNMTGFTAPTSSGVITRFEIYLCDLTGTLNVSGLTGLSGIFKCSVNANLTGVTLPTSSGVFTEFSLNDSDITGTLNLSGLSNLGGLIQLYNNSLLTGITWPSSSQAFTNIGVYGTDITGTMDMSGLDAVQGVLQIRDNTNLTDLILPSGTENITSLLLYNQDQDGIYDITGLTFSSSAAVQVQSQDWSTAEVNEMLVAFDTNFPSSGSMTIQIHGSNSAPDTSSGGNNGDAAAANLALEGHAVTTT